MTAGEEQHSKQTLEAINQSLENFVVDNDDLLDLESQIGRFNIFDALGIAHKEIRHSNFLAFILDPAESHGQGPLFLRALLMDLLKNTPAELRPNLSPIDLDGADLQGVEIKREWKNIDLLITCKEPKFIVVVENKVDSGEHSNQLSKYEETIKEHFPDDRPLYVYLSPDGHEPSRKTWMPYTYEAIFEVINRIRKTSQNSIGVEVLVFLDHYLNLLRTRFMNNEKIDELCRKIYKTHRQALDVIWDRVENSESPALAALADLLKTDERFHVFWDSAHIVDFVLTTWPVWLPKSGSEDSYSFCVDVGKKEGRLEFALFVGPMKDAAKRTEIITKLREECPKCGFRKTRATKLTQEWSRITANEIMVK